MQYENRDQILIELGRVSIATKGCEVGFDDQEGGLELVPGLSDD